MIKEQQKKIEIGTVIKLDTSGKQAKIIYLGIGSRGTTRKEDPSLAKVYWRGRVTTFDKLFWNFEVINGYN